MRRLLTFVIVGILAGAIRPDVCAQAWTLDPAVAPVFTNEPSVLTSVSFAPLPGGRMLASGVFSHVNGIAAPHLARLRTDGALDAAFSAELADDEYVYRAAPLSDGRVLVIASDRGTSVIAVPVPVPATNEPTVADPTTTNAGSATGGVVISPSGGSARLIRLRADGRKDAAFAPVAIEGGVPQIAMLDGGRLLLWGTFRSIGGAARNGLARLNADGTLDASFAPALTTGSLNVNAVAPAPDGALMVSGVTYARTGPATYFFTRLLSGGEIDARFTPAPVGTAFGLVAVQPDGSVLAGNGSLTRYTPTGAIDRTYRVQIPDLKTITRIAELPAGQLAVEARVGPQSGLGRPVVFTLRLDGTVSLDFRKIPSGSEGQLLGGAFADGRVLVLQGPLYANAYSPLPMEPQGAATTTTADPQTSVSIVAPIFLGPALYQPQLAMASADGSSFTTLPTAITQRSRGTVSQIAIDATDRALVAGTFTHVNGQPRSGIARFLANGALDSTFVPAAERMLFAPPDGRPIVARTVLGPIGSEGYHTLTTQIARLQVNGAIDTGFAFPTDLNADSARCLAVGSDGRLLISAFEPPATSEANLKLVWLGSDGRRASTLPTKFSGFTRIYPVPLATTPGATSGAATGGMSGGSTGSGTTATPLPLDPAVSPVSPTIMPPNYFGGLANPIDSVRIVAGQRLLVAGGFSLVNGIARPDLVRLNADGSVDMGYAPPLPGSNTPVAATPAGPMPVDPTIPVVIAVRSSNTAIPLADGRAIVFTNAYPNGRWEQRIIRLRTDGTLDPTFQPAAGSLPSNLDELRDGSFFASGRHYSVDGVLDRNFAPRFGETAGYAAAGAMDSAGRLWIGGYFDQIDGRTSGGLARYTSSEIVGITFGPVSRRVVAGRAVTFDVVIGTNRAATYQWSHDGKPIVGATKASFTISRVAASDAGAYRVAVTIGSQTFTSEPAVLTVLPNTARLINFSARSRVDASGPAQIAGVVCRDIPPRPVLLRAVGRGMPGASSAAMLPVPVLALHGADRIVAEDRGSATAPSMTLLASEVGAFPMPTSTAFAGTVLGSALSLPMGASSSFTATTLSGDGGDGISLFELYDTGASQAEPLIRNLAIRGRTDAGASVLTAGFVIAGDGPLLLLIRGIGPALANFGVTGAVADPVLTVFASGRSDPLATNDNWGGDPEIAAAAASVRAFPLPDGSRDAAVVLNLEPGAYTAQLTTANNMAGEAMIELYVLER